MNKAELQEEYDALKREHAALKDRVVRVATKAAVAHDLCHVLEETLDEIGLEVPDIIIEVTQTIRRTFRIPVIDAARHGLEEGMSEDELSEAMADVLRWSDAEFDEAFLVDSTSEATKAKTID